MPIVRIELLAGRTPALKRALIKGVTEAVVAALAVPPAQVRVNPARNAGSLRAIWNN